MHEAAEIRGAGGAVHIGIVANDQRVLATQLQAAFLQMRAGAGGHLAANRRRAGERIGPVLESCAETQPPPTERIDVQVPL